MDYARIGFHMGDSNSLTHQQAVACRAATSND
jgi:hypothetical protein